MRKLVSMALAYVGVIVGAGFASGQEIMQYFVAFGAKEGLLALLLAGFLFIISAKFLLELGSLYNAKGHDQVLNNIVPKWLAVILDISFVIANFGIGLVMIAGAGTNLNQQFGLPVWMGSVAVGILIILACFLDVDKVTELIGGITPFLVLFFLIIGVYAITNIDMSLEEMDAIALNQVKTTLPNWWLSAINYVTFNLMTGVSMAMVMGGDEFKPKSAGRGGIGGGIIIAILLFMSAAAMFSQVDLLVGDNISMPMLELVNQIHPILGTVMSFVIFAMIYNTGLGMFFAVSSRLVKNDERKFRITTIITVSIAFVASFAGFENLVAYLYPAIGYVGIVLLIVIIVAWFRKNDLIKKEDKLRHEMIDLGEEAKAVPVGNPEYETLKDQSVLTDQEIDGALETELRRAKVIK